MKKRTIIRATTLLLTLSALTACGSQRIQQKKPTDTKSTAMKPSTKQAPASKNMAGQEASRQAHRVVTAPRTGDNSPNTSKHYQIPASLLPGYRKQKNMGATSFTGKASYYGKRFQGRTTASGEPFNMHDMTAAHKKLPFGTLVKVTNLENGKSVIVTINDRGPYAKGRVIDLSKAAARKIGMLRAGVVKVRVDKLN